MNTGEGKTISAVFPACLEALSGRGVHILTANEYLAKRDAEWMGPIYNYLGFSIACISEKMSRKERKKAYLADITYLTMKQAGFDYLSDRLCLDPEGTIQRQLNMAIIDEADFILIDEARNPLVLARPYSSNFPDPSKVRSFTTALTASADYTLDREERNCFLTLKGEGKARNYFKCGGMHNSKDLNLFASIHASLIAEKILRKDVDYLVRNGRIEIIDQSTGRIAERRKWPYGVQTALECKEGLTLQREGRIYGSITVQHFANLYLKKSAMTATALPAEEEFSSVYGMPLTIIPPHRPERIIHSPDILFRTRGEKNQAIVNEILRENSKGQPILVGTASVRESRELGSLLKGRGINCPVLNAERDEQEAEIIADAGKPGAVTISTNMAGRGTDIKLGGKDEADRQKAVAAGGLYVIGTNRHESRRIDDQLRGRAGRQGDPGKSGFFVSLEDDLFRKFGVAEFLKASVRSSFISGPIQDENASREIDRAQRIIEGRHGEMKKTLFRYSQFAELLRTETAALRSDALVNGNLPDLLEEAWEIKTGGNGNRLKAETVKEHRRLLVRMFILELDEFWADILDSIAELREGIHLRRFSGRNPLLEFSRDLEAIYSAGLDEVCGKVRDVLLSPGFPEEYEFPEEDLSASNTWTYLINDDPLPGFNISILGGENIGMAIAYGLFGWIPLTWKLVKQFLNRFKKRPPGL